MPLSEADFYAYSRATGTPVPRDAQERAEIAPQVVGFRQGQLSATKEELDQGNFIDTAGKTALVAGLGAGAAALATGGRFGKLREALAGKVRPKDKSAVAGVKQVDLNIPAKSFDPPNERMGQLFKSLEEAMPEPTSQELAKAIPFDRSGKSKKEVYSAAVERRPLSSVAEQDYVPGIKGKSQPKSVYLSQSQQQRQDLENLRASLGDTQLELKGSEFKPNVSQLLKGSEQEAVFPVQDPYKTTSSQLAIDFTPRSYIESTGAVAPGPSSTLRKGKDPVDVLLQERELAAQRNRAQAIRAQEAKTIGKGERLLAEIQAETLVEKQNARRPLVSEQSVEAVDTGADQTFGRIMEDVQRNEDLNISSAARYLSNRRDEIASMLGEQGLAVTPGRIEEALSYEFGPKAYTFGPKQTQRKQALQLGATYNTDFFENLKTPSVQVAGVNVPVSSLKQPVVMKETAEKLGERVDRAKDAIGRVALGQRMKEVKFEQGQKQLGQLGSYAQDLKNFAQKTTDPLLADRAMGRRSDVLLEYDMLENRLNQSLGSLEAGRRGADRYRQVVGESISEMEPPARLKPGIEEGQRIFFEQDPKTLDPIPGTEEIRPERKMVNTESKTGGGRQTGEFTGAESAVRNLDIYGVQPSTQKAADPGLKPSTPRYTQAEIEEAALSLSRTDPETGVPIPPRREAIIKSMGKQRKTPEGLASIDVSRELTALQRQANQGNPRAQAQLQSFIQNMRLG
jgi:hypothetical protein